MKPYVVKGYYAIELNKNGVPHKYLIHRLVAMSFLENNLQKEEVNHIDGNKSNNNLYNLEWCTSQEKLFTRN